MARTIREQIRHELNLTASAGVAPNKFLAKLASNWRKPDGLFVIQPEDMDAFLVPLPVGRFPGVGKVTREKLAKLGIKTVGNLRTLDLRVLEDQFGRYGQRLNELAHRIDDNEVIPEGAAQTRRSTRRDCSDDRLYLFRQGVVHHGCAVETACIVVFGTRPSPLTRKRRAKPVVPEQPSLFSFR